MPPTAKDSQINTRIPRDADTRLERRAEGPEWDLLAMFNEAAAFVTQEDLEEREALLGSFVGAADSLDTIPG